MISSSDRNPTTAEMFLTPRQIYTSFVPVYSRQELVVSSQGVSGSLHSMGLKWFQLGMFKND